MKSTEIKIAHIGGGSRYWARDLFAELAQSPHLTGRVDLYDLDYAAARKNVEVAAAVFGRPEAVTSFKVRAVRRIAEALRGADFVVLSIKPGPTTMRFADLEIPAGHGIVQPVGDTTGPGGIARGLRAITAYGEFARQIAEHCPQAWVINYTNPLTLCTATLYAVVPVIRAFGCCHEVFHVQGELAKFVQQKFGGPLPARRDIKVDLTGINHFTWITAATWRGRELLPALRAHIAAPDFFRSRTRESKARVRAERWFESKGLIGHDLLRRFGVLGAAGDRHLAEFVPWYATSEAELHRWGVVLTPYSWRLRRHAAADKSPAHYAQQVLKPSIEEGVRIMEAISGFAPLDTNTNLPNCGQALDLPMGHIVETNAQFRHDRVTPLVARSLPAGARALVRRVAEVQALTLRAGLEKNVDLAFQALLADPLTRLSTDEAWTMFKAQLAHMRPSLPGWRIP